ncbi:MAG: ABC transporter ATP-binding protein [Terricaulis sp.]
MSSHGGLSVQRVTKAFGRDVVLRDVSLEVADGEILCLLGRSASGKSTLLRLIAGLTRPNAGRIVVGGLDVTNKAPQDRGVGFVFQETTALFANMSVQENVRFGLRHGRERLNRDEESKRVNNILVKTHMLSYANSALDTLSGGQKQRIALARTLVAKPKVVLLDEPLHSLDNVLRREMLDLIADLHQDYHATYLYVTHDEREAAYIASSVAVLDNEHILPLGPTAIAFNSPGTPRAATILGGWHVAALTPEACAGWARGLAAADTGVLAAQLAAGQLQFGVQIARIEALAPDDTHIVEGNPLVVQGTVERIWPWYGRWRLRVIADGVPLEVEAARSFAEDASVKLVIRRDACALWINNQRIDNRQEAAA